MSAASELLERVRALPRPLLLCFDVDGTLAPIYRDPAAVRVSDAVVSTLERLDAREGLVVAVVTGRDATSLRHVLPSQNLLRVVEHGARVLRPGAPDGPIELGEEERARLVAFRQWAEGALAPRGAHVEVKERAVGIHVRVLAEGDPEAARAVLAEAEAEAAARGLSCREGRWVRELGVGHAGDKGETVARLAAELGVAAILYAGDDLTDYGAIEAAARRGVGVFVASEERPRGPEGASLTLPDQATVLEFLALLDAEPGA